MVSEELIQVNENVTAVFCAVAMRKMAKPEEGFTEILHHCAGRYGYYDIDELTTELYKVVKNSESECENEMKMQEVQNIIEVFIDEHENMIF